MQYHLCKNYHITIIYNISYDYKKKPPDYVINKLDYLTENKCFILPMHYCVQRILTIFIHNLY